MRGVTDVRLWRDEYGPRGETGLIPAAVLIAAFAVQLMTGGAASWGLSAEALAAERFETIGLHMLAHAGLGHLFANAGALLALTPAAMRLLGRGMASWTRWSLLFAASGLCGAALFLAVNPEGSIPMVGASGAIFGLWGFTARFDADGRRLKLIARSVREQVIRFALINLALFVLIAVVVRFSGGPGRLAWEAHLGGFVFGLLAPSLFAARAVVGPDAH